MNNENHIGMFVFEKGRCVKCCLRIRIDGRNLRGDETGSAVVPPASAEKSNVACRRSRWGQWRPGGGSGDSGNEKNRPEYAGGISGTNGNLWRRGKGNGAAKNNRAARLKISIKVFPGHTVCEHYRLSVADLYMEPGDNCVQVAAQPGTSTKGSNQEKVLKPAQTTGVLTFEKAS